MDLPDPVRGTPGSFAAGVLHERNPAILRQVASAWPYPPSIRRALDDLAAEVTGGLVAPLPIGAHDHDSWASWAAPYVGRPWIEAPFLWAESYFYRRVLEAVGYFGAGPWRGVDPYGPAKAAELAESSPPPSPLSGFIRNVGRGSGEPRSENDAAGQVPEWWLALTEAAMWGNRADLGFRLSAAGSARATADGSARPTVDGDSPGTAEPPPALLVDDRAAAWQLVGPTVALVADNAGGELLADLALIDHLLNAGVERVELHLKPYPYFVSDATTDDLLACLDRLGPGADRLRAALGTGRLDIVAHPFAVAPYGYRDMPADLAARFRSASLTIFKGDLNHRRLVGDRHWPPTTPFAALTGYLPGPALSLRTLKSDVVVGLPVATVAALDATGTAWRTTGTYALAQLTRGQAEA